MMFSSVNTELDEERDEDNFRRDACITIGMDGYTIVLEINAGDCYESLGLAKFLDHAFFDAEDDELFVHDSRDLTLLSDSRSVDSLTVPLCLLYNLDDKQKEEFKERAEDICSPYEEDYT